MTVSDLIAKLSCYPADARVTLLCPDEQWLLPLRTAQPSLADALDNESRLKRLAGRPHFGLEAVPASK